MAIHLRPKQIKFIQAYLLTGNATQAYIDAGYKAKTRVVATRNASRLITNDDIKEIVQAELKLEGLTLFSLIKRLKQIILKPQEMDGSSVAALNIMGKWMGYEKFRS